MRNPLTSLGWQMIAILILAIIALVLLLGYCSQRDRAEKADDQAAYSEGRTVSAGEAMVAIQELGREERATDAQVEQAHEAIRQTPVGPERNRRARFELCRLQHRPDCDRLLNAG